jgi:hypothetical protein
MVLGVVLFLALGCSSSDEGEGINGVGGMAAPTGGSAGVGGMAAPSGGVGGAMTGGASGAAGMVTSGGVGGASGMGTGGTMTVAGAGAGGDMSDAGTMDTPDGSVDPGFPRLPKVTTTDGMGSFTAVTKEKSTPPGGWLIYPTNLGEGGMRHPIFIFGPGGGTTPMTYETSGMHWDRYASYGFVIYVLPQSTGDGSVMKAGLDWVLELNEDSSHPLYQKLDTTMVAASGHSMGSVTTFDFMPDDRVTTTIHISGGSFDMMGPASLRGETMFMCAPNDVALPQCETDFEVTTVPTFYTVVQGADHLTSARLGWPATIAWLLWHLAGHDEWRKEFLEAGGQFQTGMYDSQLKNW